MRCEICGKKIFGRPLTIKIEGSEMRVCKDCSKFGEIQRRKKIRKRVVRRRVPRFKEPSYDIVENYGKIVREAREERNWSREDLAKKINEKVSVVGRIETEKMVPDINLARKLEKTLNIKLLEKLQEEEELSSTSYSTGELTIGDIAKIRKK